MFVFFSRMNQRRNGVEDASEATHILAFRNSVASVDSTNSTGVRNAAQSLADRGLSNYAEGIHNDF